MTHLILHKVRGKPAFDIAESACPGPRPCQPECGCWDGEKCSADGEWIIPTSGHRAHPVAILALDEIEGQNMVEFMSSQVPEEWPDHYSANDRPIKGAKSGLNLMDFITLPPPKVKLVRRRV